MKIVTFHGGLGNQLFIYTYYKWLCKHSPGHKVYGFYPSRGFRAHNGLEIEKWFEAELPGTTWWSNSVSKFFFWFNKIFIKLGKPRPFTNNDWYRKDNAMIHHGYWQDKKYLLEIGAPQFKESLQLNDENKEMLNRIQSCNSVAVHIRRGDYLIEQFRKMYGDICTLEYYKNAMKQIESQIQSPVYFFFSDDIDFVKENFTMDNKVIVDINQGENSFFDIYLMSNCQNMIIANSSFSCWAAYENKNEGMIIAPKKWRNDKPSPDILLDNWIKI